MDRAARRPGDPAPSAHRDLTRRALVVALGGAVGAVLRWALQTALPDGGGFPWATLAINLSGSGLLALLPALPAVRRRPLMPLLLGTGVLGGYTTLSSYAEQARSLAAGGRPVTAAAYVVGSLAACLVAVRVVQHATRLAGWLEFEVEEGNE